MDGEDNQAKRSDGQIWCVVTVDGGQLLQREIEVKGRTLLTVIEANLSSCEGARLAFGIGGTTVHGQFLVGINGKFGVLVNQYQSAYLNGSRHLARAHNLGLNIGCRRRAIAAKVRTVRAAKVEWSDGFREHYWRQGGLWTSSG